MVHTKTPKTNPIFICVLMGPRRLDYSELPYYPLPRYKDFCPMNSPVGNGQKTGQHLEV